MSGLFLIQLFVTTEGNEFLKSVPMVRPFQQKFSEWMVSKSKKNVKIFFIHFYDHVFSARFDFNSITFLGVNSGAKARQIN
jgi:hypothetical protein